MSNPSIDVATKISCAAAEHFVDTFYSALQSSRANLASFYVLPSSMPDGKALPTIVYNGNVILDAVSFQNTFEKQMPATHFEVQAYDCHVINPNYTAVGSERSSGVSGKNMTILVIVSGYIRLGESRDGAMRGFSETFVLVPNPDPANAKGPKHLRKDWLIQSQNFRLVI